MPSTFIDLRVPEKFFCFRLIERWQKQDFIAYGDPSILYTGAGRPANGRRRNTADHDEGGMGSVPHPDQELTRIDPAEVGGGSVVGFEVIPQTVLLGSVGCFDPVDGPVLRVGDGSDQVGEGGEGHRSRLLVN